MEYAVTVRPACAEDTSFLYALYTSTRAAELALVDWGAAQQAAFLTMQFTAQERYYRTVYADAERRIILVNDHPVGRMDVERQPCVILLMGFVLLPEYRGRGIGSHVLRALLDEAARAGTSVRLHV
ncbi:MAG: GNAT family N-acetyltransferase, partial [Chloroflexota bacterium]|nr:GNAT family N-acetyltransferase [Chloroflexota bacterium]